MLALARKNKIWWAVLMYFFQIVTVAYIGLIFCQQLAKSDNNLLTTISQKI